MLRILPILLILTGCSSFLGTRRDPERYFLTQVKPVLQQHCLRCHNGALPPPALNLTSKATAFQRNKTGRDYILSGDPDCSLLISAVQRGGSHPKMMPRTEISLTDDQIGMLREWIEDGAYWPAGVTGTLRPQPGVENP